MDEYGKNQKLKHPRIGFLPTAKSLTWDLPGNKNLKQKNWNGLHYERPKEEDHKGYPPKQSKNLGVWFLLPVSHQNLVGSLSFLNSFSVLGSQSKIGSKRHHRGRPFLQKIIKNEDQSPVWRCIQLPLAPPRFRHITTVHDSLLSLTVPNSLACRMLEVRKWLCTFNRWDMGI